MGKKISYIDTEEEDARKAMESMGIKYWRNSTTPGSVTDQKQPMRLKKL
jgi:hypothetical protein